MEEKLLIEEISRLKKENNHLKELLKKHNIPYEEIIKSNLSTKEKVSIYKSYFKGRTDVFTEKYMKKDGTKGYSFVCENKNKDSCLIKNGVLKPCLNCKNRINKFFDERCLLDHMKGDKSYGIYPIVDKEKCFFLAIDFDGEKYDGAALAYKEECKKLGIDAVIELSQSGKGAHVWIFFENEQTAKKARMLGDYILLNAMSNNNNISFGSYDRFFPSQDVVGDNGYGNCIALPLQGNAYKNRTSVFVDDDFFMIPNQIEYLSSVKKVSDFEFNFLLNSINVNQELFDTSKKSISKMSLSKIDFPLIFKIIIHDDIYFSKKELSTKALIALKRLAVLYNPEFYEKQAKRMSTYKVNRIIELYKENDEYIGIR